MMHLLPVRTLFLLVCFCLPGLAKTQGGGCSNLQPNVVPTDPCCYSFQATNLTPDNCYQQIQLILTGGTFTTFTPAAGWRFTQPSPTEVNLRPSIGFIPQGVSNIADFCVDASNVLLTVLYDDLCAMEGCAVDINLDGCENGSISGIVYRECDSGRYRTQPTLAEQTVELYDENNFLLDEVKTGQDGFYAFYDLPKGQYYARIALQPGWTPNVPPVGEYLVDLLPGEEELRDFGLCPECSCDSIFTDIQPVSSSRDTCTYLLTSYTNQGYCFETIEIELGSGSFANPEVLFGDYDVEILSSGAVKLIERRSSVSKEKEVACRFSIIGGGDTSRITVRTPTAVLALACTSVFDLPCPVRSSEECDCPPGWTEGPELMINGDFTNTTPGVGYTSQYPNGIGQGTYSIGNSIDAANYPGENWQVIGKSGDPVNDNFMMINVGPGYFPGYSLVLYESDPIFLNPGFISAYKFSVSTRGLFNHQPNYSYNPLSIRAEIWFGSTLRGYSWIVINPDANFFWETTCRAELASNTNPPLPWKIRLTTYKGEVISAWKSDFALDCVSIRECIPPPPPDTCCASLDSFCMKVENAVSISVDNKLCKATFSIDSLRACDSIEYVNWGDAMQDNGPFGANSMVMHTYNQPGTYYVSYSALEYGADSTICFQKTITDTITLSCDSCTCLGFSNLAFHNFANHPDIPVTCDSTQAPVQLPCIASDALYWFTGNFGCSTTACPFSIEYAYMTPAGQILASDTSVVGGGAGFLLNGFKAPPGIYQLMLTGICGVDTCKCIIPFEIPDCGCRCGTFSNIVAQSGPNSYSLPCGNSPIPVPCPPIGVPLVFQGLFQCQGPNCPPTAPVNWMLTTPSGFMVNGTTPLIANPGFTLNLDITDFKENGVYCLKFTGKCGGQDCDPCIVKFEITNPVDTCQCRKPEAFDLLYSISRGPLLPVHCGDTLGIPATHLSFSFLSSFHCQPDSCDPNACVDWVLTGPPGFTPISQTCTPANPNFTIPLTHATFAYAGLYTLTMVGHGGQDSCECVLYFNSDGTCCTDRDAFCDRVENNTNFSIDPAKCKVTLNIGNLPPCDSIAWVHWGSGPVFGPFGAGDMPMHYFSQSGTYIITWLAVEKDSNGLYCFNKVFMDTITLQCDRCECGRLVWAEYYHTSSISKPVICNNTSPIVIGCRKFGPYFFIHGDLTCLPDSCGNDTVYWELDRPGVLPNTFGLSTASSYPHFDIDIPWGDFSQGGNYTLTATRFCGNKPCHCQFNITVETCPCTCDTLAADVASGFSVSGGFPDCKRTIQPKSLCPNDQVFWTLNGAPVGSTAGNNSVMIIFTNPGIHTVCMDVARVDPITGQMCTERYCKTLKIDCAVNPGDPKTTFFCEVNALQNGDFTENLLTGHCCPANSVIWEKWILISNRATSIVLVDAQTGANDDGHVILHANKNNFAGIAQEVTLPPESFVNISLEVIDYNPDMLMLGTKLEFRQQLEPIQDSPFKILYSVDLDNAWRDRNGNCNVWAPVNYSVNVAVNPDLPFLVICLQNESDTQWSTIGIDNIEICTSRDPIVSTTDPSEEYRQFRLFPNPTTGNLILQLSEGLQGKSVLQIKDLWGRTVQSESLAAGATKHELTMANLPQGIYFIKVLEDGVPVWVQKVVRQ